MHKLWARLSPPPSGGPWWGLTSIGTIHPHRAFYRAAKGTENPERKGGLSGHLAALQIGRCSTRSPEAKEVDIIIHQQVRVALELEEGRKNNSRLHQAVVVSWRRLPTSLPA